MDKLCTTCQLTKPVAEFNSRRQSKDGLSHSCKMCHRTRSNNWYSENTQRVKDRTKADRKLVADKIRTYKETAGCKFCPETYFRCLQFHHVDPSHKDFNVSEIHKHGLWRVALQEIEKCIVVCGNCHVKIHDGLVVI